MFAHKRFASFGTILLAFAAGACDRADSPLEPAAARGASAVIIEADPPGLDGEFARLARRIPGFGGYYFDEGGDLNVLLARAGQEDAVRAALAGVAAGRLNRPDRPYTARAAIRVRQARYDFLQLNRWRGSLRSLLSPTGAVSLDVDEAANRVRVGVVSDEAAADVRARAAALGIPGEALIVERTEPARPATTLQDYVRPIVGGVRIQYFSGILKNCSLGVNASYLQGQLRYAETVFGFVTASHCTQVMASADGTSYTQGGVSIGTELIDPAVFTSSTDPACPPNWTCRYSDAAFVQYGAGVSYSMGTIARVLWEGTSSAGSLELQSTPHQIEPDFAPAPVVGEHLHKVGATSGGTWGPVYSTCGDVAVSGTNILLLCQDAVQAWADGGDSGAPVWAEGATGVKFYGIVWGKSGSLFRFSHVSQIQRDFGPRLGFW